MKILLDYNLEEMEKLVTEFGQAKFRAKQLYKWCNLGVGFDDMSDLPKDFKQRLNLEFSPTSLSIERQFESNDGTKKFIYKLLDGNIIEGVFMQHDYGNTLCISTQVGCRMGCGFCASGIGGLIRNLTCGEILGQVIEINKLMGGDFVNRKITNLVLMGSGEPLDNYENVIKFIHLVSSSEGLNVSRRNISLSTCGLVDKIYSLADEVLGVTLSISLHATTDEARMRLMPIANKYTIDEIMKAARYYFDKTGRRIIFEYSMVKGNNINFFDAKRLAELTKGFPSHVNLIMLNFVKEKDVVGCSKTEGEKFLQRLKDLGVSATIRRSMGADIGGACGQLRNLYVGQKDPVSSEKNPKNQNI